MTKLYKIAVVLPSPMTRIEISVSTQSDQATVLNFLAHISETEKISVIIYSMEGSNIFNATTFYGSKENFIKQERLNETVETPEVLQEDEEEDPFTDPPLSDTGTSLMSFERASGQVAKALNSA